MSRPVDWGCGPCQEPWGGREEHLDVAASHRGAPERPSSPEQPITHGVDIDVLSLRVIACEVRKRSGGGQSPNLTRTAVVVVVRARAD